jgi:hypothetical protein
VIPGLHDRNAGVEWRRDAASPLPGGRLLLSAKSAHFPDIDQTARCPETV